MLYALDAHALSAPSALIWLGVGLAIALLLVAVREFGRNSVTSIASLGKYRGFVVLGAAPELTAQTLRTLPPDKRSPPGCVIHQPASAFASAFRDLQAAIANDQLVAVIASLPGEGASTVALCTAISAAQQGRRVLLLDCDLRGRTFTSQLEHKPEFGLAEACAQPEAWRDFIDEEEESGLHFIPAAPMRSPWNNLATAPGFPILLNHLRDEYDLIMLDCPPALRTADGPVIARMADKCIIVAAWDQTPVSALRASVRALRGRARTATGVYVNRVPENYRFGRLRPN